MKDMAFLRTVGTSIVDHCGKPIILRGINLGGWLNWEGYILHSPNRAATYFRKAFIRSHGKVEFDKFVQGFRKNFIIEEDLRRIASWGMNCIRVPFHYRLIESGPSNFEDSEIIWLDRVIKWAKKFNLYVILDLHAAPGAQNHDWHADSLGPARLWSSPSCRRRTLDIWEYVSDRYKNNSTVAGYDILNEAVTNNTQLLNQFYKGIIKRIRQVDKQHIIFVEGNNWAQDLECLDVFEDDNYALSMHNYEPLDFTFNFVPHLTYPSSSQWKRVTIREHLKKYQRLSKERKVPIFVGEFGVNYRGGLYGEDQWLKDVLKIFEEFGFHWTYWTYKAVKNQTFPDGALSFYPNPKWVRREGPFYGWDNYTDQWPTNSSKMSRSWRSDAYQENNKVVNVLRSICRT